MYNFNEFFFFLRKERCEWEFKSFLAERDSDYIAHEEATANGLCLWISFIDWRNNALSNVLF